MVLFDLLNAFEFLVGLKRHVCLKTLLIDQLRVLLELENAFHKLNQGYERFVLLIQDFKEELKE